MQRVTIRQFVLLIAMLSLAAGREGVAGESATKWRFHQSDCYAVINLHAVESSLGTQGGTAEHIRIRAGAGTFCYFDRDIEDTHVIDDFVTKIRLRSNRTGLSAMARIRFPHVMDTEGQPVSVLIRCDEYDQPGAWQELRIDNLAKRVQEHIRYVRQKHGRTVDVSSAFVDGIVLNVFGGPGTTDLLIGEMTTRGNVPLGSVITGQERSADKSRSSASRHPRAVMDDGMLRIGESLFAASVIEYRGEPLSLIARLGFNVIALKQLPSKDMIADAVKYDLWMMCPASLAPVGDSADDAGRILFWNIDPQTSESSGIADGLQPLRRRDRHGRMWVGTAKPVAVPSSLRYFSRSVDIASMEFGTVNGNHGSGSSESLVSRFEQFKLLVANSSSRTCWAKLDSSNKLFSEFGVEQALAAVAAGANGIWFTSNRSLTGDDPRSHLRRKTLEATNLRLQSIRPWIVGTGRRRVIAQSKSPPTRVVQLMANNAGLLLLVNDFDAKFDSEPIIITAPSTTESSDVFQVLPTGLRPLKNRRVTGGLAITLNDIDSTCPIVVTENRLATNQLARFASATRRRSVAIHKSLAEASIRFAETDSTVESTQTARQFFDRGIELLDSGDSTSAYHSFQRTRRELFRR